MYIVNFLNLLFLDFDPYLHNTFDFTKNPLFLEAKDGIEDRLKYFLKKLYNKTASNKKFKEFMKGLYWHTGYPCFDTAATSEKNHEIGILKQCMWKGNVLPCKDIFAAIPTDRGLCCAFNIEKAENIYKNQEYVAYLNKQRNEDKELAFSDVGGAANGEANNNNFIPMEWEEGKEKGLSLILDAHINYADVGSINTDYEGFSAYVGNRNDYPWIKKRGFTIQPGKITKIKMEATTISATKTDIGHINPKKRNCYFEDEYRLKGHIKYRWASCVYECGIAWTIAKSNISCLPINFVPLDENLPWCDVWELNSFMETFELLEPSEHCQHCLYDCKTTMFSLTHTSSNYRY